jgi:hypothetical protein
MLLLAGKNFIKWPDKAQQSAGLAEAKLPALVFA